SQKRKVEYLAAKFLDNLQKSDPTLYVRAGGGAAEAMELANIIANKNPKHDFHVLIVRGDEGEGAFEHADHPRITVYRMNKQIDKPPVAHWQGDNARWGALLDPVLIEKSTNTLIAVS
ncbi:hypothetical protein AB4144_42035, partial [Rhizobiaceae sp. 2RAB30]